MAVIRSRAESRDKERHGAQARARQTSTSVYVWLDYAMIRSLPILSRAKRLVGMVSLGDLAVSSGNEMRVGETLKQVSEPRASRTPAVTRGCTTPAGPPGLLGHTWRTVARQRIVSCWQPRSRAGYRMPRIVVRAAAGACAQWTATKGEAPWKRPGNSISMDAG